MCAKQQKNWYAPEDKNVHMRVSPLIGGWGSKVHGPLPLQ